MINSALVFPGNLSNLSRFLPEVNKRLWSELSSSTDSQKLTKEAGLIDLLLYRSFFPPL